MKKSDRRRSKSKKRVIITLSIIGILALSLLSVIFLGLNSSNTNNTQTPIDSTVNPPTSSNPTPIPNPSYDVKVLNKQIPSNYIMGFPAEVGLTNGMNVVFIHNSNEKISIRFTAQKSGTVSTLVVYALAYEDQPAIRVGLQEDSGGNPKGEWINGNAFGSVQLTSGNSFTTIKLQASAAITKGQTYHIVIEASENPLSGIAAFNTYQANSLTQPFNPDDPDIVWDDSMMDILSYDGRSWQKQNKWPIFVVEYSDGTSEGQPYSLVAPWVVYGSTCVGQALTPASDYKVGKIAFVVGLKANKPQDGLYFRIVDGSNNVQAEGIFAQPNQLATSQTWVEVILSNPTTLEAGQLYRIFVQSPQTNLANAYHIYGHEFCYEPLIGYGSLQHQLTSSYDGGANWVDNKDADAIFKLITK